MGTDRQLRKSRGAEARQAKHQPTVSGPRALLCYEIAALLNPDLRPTDLRGPMEEIFVRPGTPEGIPNAYVLLFVAGALQILAAVEAK